MSNSEFGMRNQARRARIVLHKRFFRGERQTRFAIENCYGRSFYGLSPKAAAPKGWRGRAESPLLASAEAKPSATSKALPHNSSAALAMPFLPSASCRNLDLPPVNLRFLQSHLTKNAFAIAPTHLCGIALRQRRTIRRRVGRCLFRQPTTSFVRCYLNMRSAV